MLFTQGRSSFLGPTLGFGAEPRWGWECGGVKGGDRRGQLGLGGVTGEELRWTQPRWGWEDGRCLPRVGPRSSDQPWALGRNPVGVAGSLGLGDFVSDSLWGVADCCC